MTEFPSAHDNYNLALSTTFHCLLEQKGKIVPMDLRLENDPLDPAADSGDEEVEACGSQDHGTDSIGTGFVEF